ncbi:Uncharacterised protein [Vibrio cholerae]|nr:Uncharacterised protein [Vibrio cholerae]
MHKMVKQTATHLHHHIAGHPAQTVRRGKST